MSLRSRFSLRFSQDKKTNSQTEPMDIDHVRPQNPCQYCRRLGHHVKNCRTRLRHIHSVTLETAARHNGNRYIQSQSNFNGWKRQIDCWNCGKIGHIRRECRSAPRHRMNYNNKPLN